MTLKLTLPGSDPGRKTQDGVIIERYIRSFFKILVNNSILKEKKIDKELANLFNEFAKKEAKRPEVISIIEEATQRALNDGPTNDGFIYGSKIGRY